MKINFRNIMFAAGLVGALSLASCKDNTIEAGVDNDADMETEGETFEKNELDTQADTVAKVNRENPEISVGEQVP